MSLLTTSIVNVSPDRFQKSPVHTRISPAPKQPLYLKRTQGIPPTFAVPGANPFDESPASSPQTSPSSSSPARFGLPSSEMLGNMNSFFACLDSAEPERDDQPQTFRHRVCAAPAVEQKKQPAMSVRSGEQHAAHPRRRQARIGRPEPYKNTNRPSSRRWRY